MSVTPYQLQGPTRICAATSVALLPGALIYSVLLDQSGQFVRKDFSEEAWPGPPDGAIAYWRGRVPDEDQVRRPAFNDELLLDCFSHLIESQEPAHRNFRYVVALLLMRRKRLKFEDVKKHAGEEYLCVREVKGGRRHEILDPHLSDEEMLAVQDEIFRVLGWE